jgi:protoheme IX farnesyltransferase
MKMMKERINIIFELIKFRITIFVSLTTLFGFVCAVGEISISAILPTLGILFLSFGSAALNHYQERNLDCKMDRTKNRPIPSGRIQAKSVLIISILLSVVGAVILFLGSGVLPSAIGLLTLIWYNAIYTPLKQRFTLAIIPGSVIGALPPVVGWLAGGGFIFDFRVIVIAFFFFIWQIPHFWILLLTFGDDYEKAGLPTLRKYLNQSQLVRMIFVWTVAVAVSSLFLPLFNVIEISYSSYVILIAAMWLIVVSSKLLRDIPSQRNYKFAFRVINLFVLSVVVLVTIEKLVIIF